MFALSALTGLLLLNYVAKRLGDLVGKGLPWQVIAEFLLLSVPFTIAMTLPMAVLVSTLHAFSRMAAENEIVAFKASGMSIRRLMIPIVIAGFGLTLTMVWFNDQVLPRANHELSTLTNDIARKKPTFALKEQIINEVTPGRLFLRMVKLDRSSSMMRDVTIYDMSDPLKRRTIRADSGLLHLSPSGTDLNLTLYSGSILELSTQEPGRLQRMLFATNFVRVRGVGNQLERSSVPGVKGDREMTVCELQALVGRAIKQRDSAYREILRMDSVIAKKLTPTKVAKGSANAYCQLRTMSFVRTASAQVPQNPPQNPPPKPPAPTPGAPATTPAQGTPPASAGVALPGQFAPGESTDPASRSALIELQKISLQQAQAVIDGNQVEIEKKFAIAAACVIFVLLGAPVALRFPRGGVGLTIGVSLGVFGLYYVGLIVGESLARRHLLRPFVAMWAANAILLTVGLVLLVRLGNEGATSRGSETSELVTRWIQAVKGFVQRRRGVA